jgi:hypothetical protein
LREKILQNARQVRQDIIVPVPNHHHAFVSEPACTAVVGLLRLFRVLSAIDLDREAKARAIKIEHVITDRVLTPKRHAELVSSQRLPKSLLSLRRDSSQPSRL